MLIVLTYARNNCYTAIHILNEYLTSEEATRDPILEIDESTRTYKLFAVDSLHMNPGTIEKLSFNQKRRRYIGMRGHVIGLYDCSTFEGIEALMWASRNATDDR